jgi:integrase
MLRDTFAVELLLAGMGLAEVSRLLTHASIRTTEKHYAPWVKAREAKLEAEMVEAMQKMGAKFSA